MKFKDGVNSKGQYTVDLSADSVMDAVYQLKYANELMGRKPKYLVLARESYARLNYELKSMAETYQGKWPTVDIKEVIGLHVVQTGEPGMSIQIGE